MAMIEIYGREVKELKPAGRATAAVLPRVRAGNNEIYAAGDSPTAF